MDLRGWTLINFHVNADTESFETKDLYNLRLKNTGEVSLWIDTLEIPPGACEKLGLEFLPCAMEVINFKWGEEQGRKSLTVTAVKVIQYCCE